MIGRTISRYTITKKLGTGEIGGIYSAEHINLDRPPVVNALSDAFTDGEAGKAAISLAPEFVER